MHAQWEHVLRRAVEDLPNVRFDNKPVEVR
jgi:hypothetical protein